jgi:hypothetical protein
LPGESDTARGEALTLLGAAKSSGMICTNFDASVKNTAQFKALEKKHPRNKKKAELSLGQVQQGGMRW